MKRNILIILVLCFLFSPVAFAEEDRKILSIYGFYNISGYSINTFNSGYIEGLEPNPFGLGFYYSLNHVIDIEME